MKNLVKNNKSRTIQDKSKFVLDILDYSLKRKVDDKTKDRLINLIGKEIEKTGIIENSILERLQKIEDVLEPEGQKDKSDKLPSGDKLHRPKETKSFLSLFNNSEGLKYLTHKFNDGKRDYISFIELCKNEFNKGKIDFPNVPDAVLRRIEEFSFATNPEWYVRKGLEKFFPKKGWAEAEFIEWYNEKINIHPGLDSKWNNEMIIPFKESIEVRAGYLKGIIEDVLNTSLGESKSNFLIKLNEQNLNTAEFYTDVDRFKLGLFHIISTIKDRADKNFCFEIEIDFINELLDGGNFKKVIITHINSEATKISIDKDFIKGDLKTIRNNLWGLCNYEVKGKFPDGFKSITILTDEDKPNQIIDKNSKDLIGFTHVLKFY